MEDSLSIGMDVMILNLLFVLTVFFLCFGREGERE